MLSALSALGNPNETVSPATAAEIAQALVGSGVSISNVTYTGSADARGSFSFTDPTVVGFNQGIILSSGRAVDVVGPNDSDWTSTDYTNPGDADLTALSTYDTFDAAVLEFDFMPSANQVVFQYTFASDEYPEWVDTAFNDVFAFYVNGTNYAEVRQVAGDPTSPFVPVAVNNINDSNPVHTPPPIAMRPDLFRPNYYNGANPSVVDLELDGITRVLTFQAPVIPNAINHMKLAISDASDGIYDSAVFIQAGSLVSNENPVADLSLSPESGAAPLNVTAYIEGEDPNGLALTYTIDWGDGSTSSGKLDQGIESEKTAIENHTYTLVGSHKVSLIVTNSQGTISTASTEDVDVFGIGSGPIVTLQPQDQTVNAGEWFTFTAAAAGSPDASIQWQISTDGGDSFEDIPGATSATYSDVASAGDNGNQYLAVFSNADGSTDSNPAVLTVNVGDTTPPAAPGVALANDTGSSAADNITKDGTLALSDVEVDAFVEYSTDGGQTWRPDFTAVEGINAILVRQTDAAGNVGEATSFSFELDTTRPVAPGVALANDSGSSATDNLTNDGTLSLSDVEANADVVYSADGGASWSGSFAAAEGANSVRVQQTDLAGNVSDAALLDFLLDTTPPSLNPTFSATLPLLVGTAGVTVSMNATDANGIASPQSAAVDTASAGQKSVSCTAVDNAGNSTTMNVPYVVGYNLVNVSPLAGATFKTSSSIAISFQVADAHGVISDQAAAGLISQISIKVDGQSFGGVKYNSKKNTFTLTIKAGALPVGPHNLAIAVNVNGVDVASALVPIVVKARR